MKYLCLLYADESRLAAAHAADARHRAASAMLARSGNLLNAERLQPAADAITIRMHDGKYAYASGPFADASEQLDSVYLIEARDLNEALRLAAGIAVPPCSALEVRPVAAARVECNNPGGDVDFRGGGSTS